MVKLDLKWTFKSLVVHKYSKQHLLVITFVARDEAGVWENFNAKEIRVRKSWAKTNVIYIKRKVRTWRNQIKVDEVWFIGGKSFLNFFPKGLLESKQ